MNTDTATKPAKSVFYDGCFKKTSDMEDAKTNNGNIDDFKYPVHRALKFDQTREAGIAKLCAGLDTKLVADGQWVIEQPKMVNNKIQYAIMEDKEFKETFTKYDASGILGCGKGSERFK